MRYMRTATLKIRSHTLCFCLEWKNCLYGCRSDRPMRLRWEGGKKKGKCQNLSLKKKGEEEKPSCKVPWSEYYSSVIAIGQQ